MPQITRKILAKLALAAMVVVSLTVGFSLPARADSTYTYQPDAKNTPVIASTGPDGTFKFDVRNDSDKSSRFSASDGADIIVFDDTPADGSYFKPGSTTDPAAITITNDTLYSSYLSKTGNFAPAPGAVNTASGDCQTDSGLAWLACPLIEDINKGIQYSFNNFIIPFLQVPPLAPGAPGTKAIRAMWEAVRALVTVGFVIVFLIIIFANTASLGIDRYTARKMLPRLIAAAILVQFSFFLSSLLIDVGNILGQGVMTLFTAVPLAATGGGAPAASGVGQQIASIGTGMAVGGVIISFVGIPTIILLAISLLVGVLGVIVTLVARQILIGFLVIVSPLAMLAWVLPHTEHWFKKWHSSFTKMVLLFPLIMIIFSVIQVVKLIGVVGPTSGTGANQIAQLLGLIAPIIGFFLIPTTFKMAGSLLSFAHGHINGQISSSRVKGGALGKNMKEQRKERLQTLSGGGGFGSKFRSPDSKLGKLAGGYGRVVGNVGQGRMYSVRQARNESERDFMASGRNFHKLLEEQGLSGDRDLLVAIATNDFAGQSDGNRRKYSYLGRNAAAQAAAINTLGEQKQEGVLLRVLGKTAIRTDVSDNTKGLIWRSGMSGKAWSSINEINPMLARANPTKIDITKFNVGPDAIPGIEIDPVTKKATGVIAFSKRPALDDFLPTKAATSIGKFSSLGIAAMEPADLQLIPARVLKDITRAGTRLAAETPPSFYRALAEAYAHLNADQQLILDSQTERTVLATDPNYGMPK